MFKKSYTIMLAIVLIIGAFMSFLGFTAQGTSIRNYFVASTCPDNTYPLYLDLDEKSLSEVTDKNILVKRDKYETERLLNNLANIGAAISYNYSNVEMLKNNYDNNRIYAYITTACIMDYRNLKDSNAVKKFDNKADYTYQEIDLGRILLAFVNDETWEDIGYRSNKTIELYLPAKDSPYYPIVISELYAALSDGNSVSYEKKEDLDSLVQKVVENAHIGEYPSKVDENQILIMAEQSFDFHYNKDRSKNTPVYPSRNVYIPVYIFWNDAEFGELVNKHVEILKSNILVHYLGYRSVDNKEYSSEAMKNGENKWNSHAPDVINVISVEDIWESLN